MPSFPHIAHQSPNGIFLTPSTAVLAFQEANFPAMLECLGHEWHDIFANMEFQDFVHQIGASSPYQNRYDILALNLGNNLLKKAAICYRKVEDFSWGYLPFAVWTQGKGNCLGIGLLLRWACELLGVKCAGVQIESHYFLRIEVKDGYRFIDTRNISEGELVWTRVYRNGGRILSFTEEIALLFQAQSYVRAVVYSDIENALLDAEFALGLAPDFPFVKNYRDTLFTFLLDHTPLTEIILRGAELC